jgi:hypothetical protein
VFGSFVFELPICPFHAHLCGSSVPESIWVVHGFRDYSLTVFAPLPARIWIPQAASTILRGMKIMKFAPLLSGKLNLQICENKVLGRF